MREKDCRFLMSRFVDKIDSFRRITYSMSTYFTYDYLVLMFVQHIIVFVNNYEETRDERCKKIISITKMKYIEFNNHYDIAIGEKLINIHENPM